MSGNAALVTSLPRSTPAGTSASSTRSTSANSLLPEETEPTWPHSSSSHRPLTAPDRSRTDTIRDFPLPALGRAAWDHGHGFVNALPSPSQVQRAIEVLGRDLALLLWNYLAEPL